MVKLRNKVSTERLTIIGALVFLESFLTPINSILAQGVWPTPVQLAWSITTGILQVGTVVGGLIEKG